MSTRKVKFNYQGLWINHKIFMIKINWYVSYTIFSRYNALAMLHCSNVKSSIRMINSFQSHDGYVCCWNYRAFQFRWSTICLKRIRYFDDSSCFHLEFALNQIHSKDCFKLALLQISWLQDLDVGDQLSCLHSGYFNSNEWLL